MLAAAMLVRGSGSWLRLIAAAVLTWRPAALAIAVMVIVVCAPAGSVPSMLVIGGPFRHCPCAAWIEITRIGSVGVSVTLGVAGATVPIRSTDPRHRTMGAAVKRAPRAGRLTLKVPSNRRPGDAAPCRPRQAGRGHPDRRPGRAPVQATRRLTLRR